VRTALVTGAADLSSGMLDELGLDTWRHVQAVNVEAQQAIDRALEPGGCGGAAAFLASGDAATMTGQTLTPDAGLVLL